MKIVSKEIDVIAIFNKEGEITPHKFQYNNTVKIDKILDVKHSRFAGQDSLIYVCQSWINEEEKVYELRFDKIKCKWYLYKI